MLDFTKTAAAAAIETNINHTVKVFNEASQIKVPAGSIVIMVDISKDRLDTLKKNFAGSEE